MASDALYQALAEALSQPSRAYRTARAALDIPNQALQGYVAGGDIADKINQRKLNRQSIEQVLGQPIEGLPSALNNAPLGTISAIKEVAPFMAKQSGANDFYTPEQTDAVTSGDPRKLALAFGGKVPRGAVSANTSARMGNVREEFYKGLIGTRQQAVQNSILNTAMKYSGAGSAQTAIRDSQSRLANLTRAKQLVDQIKAQGGKADIRQRTELASSVGRSLNPTGVLTNEALDLYIPQSLRGKVGTFQEYLQNQAVPVDFTGFLGPLSDLLDRESDVNVGLIKSFGSAYSGPGLTQLKQVNPRLAEQVEKTIQNPPNPRSASGDEEAIKWLQDFPDDPLAPAIRAKLQSKGLNPDGGF